MSSSTGKTGESGAISAGDFRAAIGLFPNNYNPENKSDARSIDSFVSEFEISEGLNQSSLLAKLTLRDGVNLLEDMRITGSEKIQIMVSQEEPIGPGETLTHKINHTFHISDVINYSRSLGTQTYQLQLVSRTAYLNQLKVKDNSFKGAIGAEVKQILSELMGNDDANKQNLFINPEGGTVNGCYPQLRPIEAINWLKRNAFDDGTPFYFFESLNYNEGDKDKKGGLVFNSHKNLIKLTEDQLKAGKFDSGLREFSMNPYSHGQDQGEDEFNRSRRVLGISTNLGMSKFNQIPRGAYGSTLTTVDIATKTVEEKPFEYGTPEEMRSLNKFKPFATEGLAKNFDKPLNEYQGRRYYSSINSLGMGDKGNYHFSLEKGSDYLQRAMAIKENLKYMQHEMEIYGDFTLFPGAIIKLNFPKAADAEAMKAGEYRDELQSGIYLITRINHIFKNNEYRMKVSIAKDSSNLDLDSKTPAIEKV